MTREIPSEPFEVPLGWKSSGRGKIVWVETKKAGKAMKFRKRSPIIEATQWSDSDELLPGMMRAERHSQAYLDNGNSEAVQVHPGDWIITTRGPFGTSLEVRRVVTDCDFRMEWEAVE